MVTCMDNELKCPECAHPMWEHHYVKGHGWKCWERMSRDNNDFCGCRHCMPDKHRLEELKKKLQKTKTEMRALKLKIRRNEHSAKKAKPR